MARGRCDKRRIVPRCFATAATMLALTSIDSTPAGLFSAREPTFSHGDLSLRILLPRSADELIDEEAFNRDERLPYWADLWPSAKALARWLIDEHPPHTKSEKPLRIIEVGCGATALASLVLAIRGFETLATDYEPEALQLAESNARRNGVAHPEEASQGGIRRGGGRLRTRLIDWRNVPDDLAQGENGGAGFDLVLGADLMYEQRHAIALADCVSEITSPTGRMLLADPGRRYLPDFIAAMKQRGFASHDLALIEEPHDDPAKPPSCVRIIECRRS